jgi:hypothetical protein
LKSGRADVLLFTAESGWACAAGWKVVTMSWQVWTLWTIFVFLVVFNFLPAAIAWVDGHPERHTIGLLSVISLFSFALWVALMYWVVRGTRDDELINRFLRNGNNRRYVQLGVAGMLAFGFGSALGGMGIA